MAITRGSRVPKILAIIDAIECGTCAVICKEFGKRHPSERFDTASLGATLYQLVQQGYLQYAPFSFGPKGGHVYILADRKQEKPKLCLKLNFKKYESRIIDTSGSVR